jgi:hypothetical protein
MQNIRLLVLTEGSDASLIPPNAAVVTQRCCSHQFLRSKTWLYINNMLGHSEIMYNFRQFWIVEFYGKTPGGRMARVPISGACAVE